MKKTLLTIALAAFAFAANAQWIVGGNLSISGSNEQTSNDKSFDLRIAPKVGYQINDKMSAGLILGFSSDSYSYALSSYSSYDISMATVTNYEGTRKNTVNSLTIKPYFRYNVVEFNKLTLFCEAAIPVNLTLSNKTTYHEEGDDVITGQHLTAENTITNNKSTIFGIDITPGFNYALSEHISVDAYINAFNLTFNMTTYEGTDNKDIDWGLTAYSLARSSVGFGFNYHF